MLLYSKSCVVCGEFFIPKVHNQLACCKECQKEHEKFYNMLQKIQKEEFKKTHRKMVGLTNDAIAAEQLGMSYGQYKAQQWCHNKQKIRRRVKFGNQVCSG